jgi:hypothetical protein
MSFPGIRPMRLSLLSETGPKFKTLKDNTVKLSDDERERVMNTKAVWHHGSGGAPSPAIKKAVIRGVTWYYSHTHRCYQAARTMDRAIKDFFSTVKPSS